MTTREPHGPDGVDSEPDTQAPGPETVPTDSAAALLDRWQAHHDGAAEPEVPPAEPIPLRPQVVAPEPTPPPEPTQPERTRLAPPDVVRRPKHVAPRRPRPRPTPSTGRATDAVVAGRDVVEALGRADDVVPAPPEPPPTAAPSAAAVRPAPARGPEVGPSLNVDFAPKLAARSVVGTLLLVALAASAGAAYLAYQDPRPITLGAAGTLLAVTLLLYAVRAGSAPTYLAIRSGQLEVTRGRTLEKFDLASRFTRIEVVGTPGRPGWKVLLGRFGKDPLVITSALVDPRQFMTELERHRPHDRA